MKCIVFRRLNGECTVVYPAPKRLAELMTQGLTEAEALASIEAKALKEAALRPDTAPAVNPGTEVIEVSQLPSSREFRDAWEKLGAGPPTINMPKARVIHAREINNTRDKATTILQRSADEAVLEGRTADATKAANDKSAVEGLNLATIATQIANAGNPTALSAIWPTELQEFRP